MAYGRRSLTFLEALGLAATFVVAIGIWTPGYSSGSDFYTDFCGGCYSDSQFANAALVTAPDWAPESGAVVTYPVYVTNPNTLEVRFYEVLVWYEWGDMDPHSARSPEDVEAGVFSSTQGPLNKSAVPGPGDPSVNEAHVEGVLNAEAFFATMQDIDIGVLPYPPGEAPGSAIDLVGPNGGPAGYARAALAGFLQDYLESGLSSLLTQLNDIATRVVNRYIGEHGVFNSHLVTVEFPDATTITAEVTQVSTGLFDIEVLVDVLPETARMPNGLPVPQPVGQFGGFSYTGPSGVGQSLLDLLDRYGVSVPGGQPDCDFACTHNGNYLECTLTCRPH